jgi:hypothetical protein
VTTSTDIDIDEFCGVLQDYALAGLKDFKKLKDETRKKIRTALSEQLEDNDRTLGNKIGRIKHGDPGLLFLPMPKSEGKDFTASFFRPENIHVGPPYTCSFTVLFWIEKANRTCALRFEPSHGSGTAHAYAHMQLTHKIFGVGDGTEDFTTDGPTWIPDSYPAIPLGYHNPMHLFIGLAVAVHGYDGMTEMERESEKEMEAKRKKKSGKNEEQEERKDYIREAIQTAMQGKRKRIANFLSQVHHMFKA